jgi:hypothetical protein
MVSEGKSLGYVLVSDVVRHLITPDFAIVYSTVEFLRVEPLALAASLDVPAQADGKSFELG